MVRIWSFHLWVSNENSPSLLQLAGTTTTTTTTAADVPREAKTAATPGRQKLYKFTMIAGLDWEGGDWVHTGMAGPTAGAMSHGLVKSVKSYTKGIGRMGNSYWPRPD